jgi:hypothetical protein
VLPHVTVDTHDVGGLKIDVTGPRLNKDMDAWSVTQIVGTGPEPRTTPRLVLVVIAAVAVVAVVARADFGNGPVATATAVVSAA